MNVQEISISPKNLQKYEAFRKKKAKEGKTQKKDLYQEDKSDKSEHVDDYEDVNPPGEVLSSAESDSEMDENEESANQSKIRAAKVIEISQIAMRKNSLVRRIKLRLSEMIQEKTF